MIACFIAPLPASLLTSEDHFRIPRTRRLSGGKVNYRFFMLMACLYYVLAVCLIPHTASTNLRTTRPFGPQRDEGKRKLAAHSRPWHYVLTSHSRRSGCVNSLKKRQLSRFSQAQEKSRGVPNSVQTQHCSVRARADRHRNPKSMVPLTMQVGPKGERTS